MTWRSRAFTIGFGLNGVVFFTAVIIALTFALTLRLCLRRGADLPVTAFLLALSLGVSMIHLFARPHVLSWLFTVIWFQMLDGSESADDAAEPPALVVPARTDAALGERAWRFCAGLCAARLYLLSAAIRYYRRREKSREGLAQRGCETLGMVTVASLAGQSDQSVRLSSCTFMFTDISPAAG